MNEKPLVNKKYLLEKFPCKMGWTYQAGDYVHVILYPDNEPL